MAKKKHTTSRPRIGPDLREEDAVNLHKTFIARILKLRATQNNLRTADLSQLVDRWQGVDPSIRNLFEGSTIAEPLFSDAFESGVFGRNCLSARDIRAIQEGKTKDVHWSHIKNCAACKAFVNALEETINDPFRNCIKPERFDAFAEGEPLEHAEIEHTRQCVMCMLLLKAMQPPIEPRHDELSKELRGFARTLASAKG
jgi:hypothetical protein